MLKYLSAIILAILATLAIAAKPPAEELEVRSGETVIRIASGECKSKVILDQIKPEFHKQFRKAEVRTAGKPTKGCWTMDAQGVFIILENGDQGYIPPEAFKPVDTI